MVDPWIIDQRAALNLALLNCTKIPALFGEDNLGNILWGLEIQREWQVISGRQKSKPSIRIDENAWFADINYFLTVVPYLVAMKSGLLPATQFLPPQSNSPSKFPITYETIDPAVALDLTNYFELIKILQVDAAFMSLENIQQILWVAHSSTVTKALPTFKQEIRAVNLKETKFSNGFGHFVEILAIMNLNTSYSPIHLLNKVFPQRLLKLSDTPPLILDMTPQQNAIIETFFAIDDMTIVSTVWELFVQIVRNGMVNVNCSIKLQQALNDFLSAPKNVIMDLLLSVVSKC